MKNLNLYNLLIILLSLITLNSCSKDELSDHTSIDNSSNFEQKSNNFLQNKLTVNATTDTISNFLLSAGIVKIEVSNRGNQILYKPLTVKSFYLDGHSLDLKDYTLVVDGNYAFLENQSEFKLSFRYNKLYVDSDNFDGVVEGDDYIIFNTLDRKIALLMLNEIIEPSDNKLVVRQPGDYGNIGGNYNPYPVANGGCSFMGTITYSYFGLSRSAAMANAAWNRQLQSEAFTMAENSGVGGVCKPFGGIDSACVIGDYFCTASFNVCCD